MIRKYLYGGPGYFLGGVTAKDLDKGTKKVAKGFNWLMGKVGDIFNTVVTAGASSDFGQTSPFALMDRKAIAKGREQVRQKAKKALEENAVYVSPSSHVAAWTQGSWDPKVGALFLASDPRLQALGAVGDLAALKYTPKAVKVGKNLSLILKKRSVISKVNKELKKGIKENSVLESYNEIPANKDIGTVYDYLDFLDNIYPNSKLNATFYHGGPKGITQFKTAKELGSTNKGINSATKDYGIYLADDKSLALYYAETNKKNNRHLYNVRVNVQNPMRYETNNWYMDKMSTTGDLRFRPGEITLKWYDRLNLKNYDGIYHTKSKNAFDNGELVMFDKNNIHIMGTPEESLMFRNWKLNPLYSSKPLLEEIPLTPEQYERSFLNYAKASKPGLFFAGLVATPPALIWYNNYLKSKAANARKWKHLKGGTINGGSLEEITVVPTRLSLSTYYPIIGGNYRYTGHSSLRARTPEYTIDTLEGFKTIPANSAIINKKSSDTGYNFITNNCADATRCALEAITGKKMNPYFFTTPGDVLDFFKENFDDVRKVKSKNSGKEVYYTNITPKQLEIIKEQLLEQILKNRRERHKGLLANARKWKHENGGIVHNSIKKHLEGAKLTFGLKLGNFANSNLGKSVISNGLSFLLDKLFNKSVSSNLEIALVAQEKELSTINPIQVAQMIEIARNQYADPDNPNANGGEIFNSYIKNQITAPILARQLEEHKKRLAAIDLQKNQAKSSAVGNFFNTLAQGGIEYLLNKYGTTEKADS